VSETVSLEFLRRKLDDANASRAKTEHNGGGPPRGPTMSDERLGKLEGEIEGLKHGQNIMIGGVGLVAAFVIGFGVYTLTRVDQVGDRVDKLSDKVNELPEKISSELRDITKTLAEVITAVKQTQQPQPPPPAPPSRR
jgi:hypothetical protein